MTAIVDLDSVMFSIGNPNKVLDDKGVPLRKDGKFVYEDKTSNQLADSCEFIMNKILTNSKCTDYIAYVKGNNTTKAKRLIDPQYKMDRHGEAPKWWNFTKGYLIENWGVVQVNDIEVDDAVNITRLQVPNSFICAIDSDLLGLEGTHYNWKKNELVGEWVTTTAQQAEYKFWSDMITGTHNNTKGLPGKGEKYAKVILDACEGKTDKYPRVIFDCYRFHHKNNLTLAIEEFYKNYKMIKILDKYEGFVIPEPIRFKKEEIREEKGIFD